MSDPTKQRRSGRVEMALPVRVRGMSNQTKFFDEPAETILISKNGFMTRLRECVDLETELHVTSLKNNCSGTFRVAWISDSSADGLHNLGLELMEAEGDLWGVHFPAPELGKDEAAAEIWLTCRRCRRKLLTTLPEAEFGHLTEGFLTARNCVTCKATTTWEIAADGSAQPSAEAAAAVMAPEVSAPPGRGRAKAAGKDLRQRGRVRVKMQVKVTRHKYGIQLEDICDTVNVSRTGAYFLTAQNYAIGETVHIIMNFKQGDLAVSVPARVVRTDNPQNTSLHAVAVHLQEERRGGRASGAAGGKK